MSGAEHGGEVDWGRLDAECGAMADTVQEMIGEALELDGGKTSWMHCVGTAITLLSRSMAVQGVNPPAREWQHEMLVRLHELWHERDAGSAAAAPCDGALH